MQIKKNVLQYVASALLTFSTIGFFYIKNPYVDFHEVEEKLSYEIIDNKIKINDVLIDFELFSNIEMFKANSKWHVEKNGNQIIFTWKNSSNIIFKKILTIKSSTEFDLTFSISNFSGMLMRNLKLIKDFNKNDQIYVSSFANNKFKNTFLKENFEKIVDNWFSINEKKRVFIIKNTTSSNKINVKKNDKININVETKFENLSEYNETFNFVLEKNKLGNLAQHKNIPHIEKIINFGIFKFLYKGTFNIFCYLKKITNEIYSLILLFFIMILLLFPLLKKGTIALIKQEKNNNKIEILKKTAMNENLKQYEISKLTQENSFAILIGILPIILSGIFDMIAIAYEFSPKLTFLGQIEPKLFGIGFIQIGFFTIANIIILSLYNYVFLNNSQILFAVIFAILYSNFSIISLLAFMFSYIFVILLSFILKRFYEF